MVKGLRRNAKGPHLEARLGRVGTRNGPFDNAIRAGTVGESPL